MKLIEINVKLLDGRALPLKIAQEKTVGDLKNDIYELTGIATECQAIEFEDNHLTDEMVLVEIGVISGDRVTVGVSQRQQARAQLIQQGIDHEETEEEIARAARNGDMDVLTWLLRIGGDPDSADQSGATALMHAAQNGRVIAMQLLISSGADVDKEGFSSETPAMWAAAKGQIEALELLADCGADFNKSDDDKDTPLMWAAANGHTQCVRLISLHCDVKATNNDGDTALDWAEGE
eukprot:gene16219-24858_t